MPDNGSPSDHPQAAIDEFSGDSPEDNRLFSLLADKDRRAIWDRLAAAAAKRPPDDPQPTTDFDRDFQRLIGPRLEGYVRLGGYLVALELESFSQAHDRVMQVARKYGASHLSDGAWFALDDWIDRALLEAIDGPMPDGLIAPGVLARITGEDKR